MKAVSTIGSRAVLSGALMIAALVAPTAAAAQDEETKPLSVSGSAAFVSDYRFRGISLSDIDPAVQAGITLTTAPGLFVGAWGSSIADFNGATTEIDLIAGWAGSLAGVDVSAGGTFYTYPGGSNTNIYEFFGTVGIPLGPVTATFGLNWSPNQKNLDRSNRYAFGTLSADIPGAPITVKATLGNERGSLVIDEWGGKTSKWDWLIGADLKWEMLTLGVAYVGNDIKSRVVEGYRYNRIARDTVVVSLSASF